MKLALLAIAAASALLFSPAALVAADTAAKKPNVLFIAIDDLNHWVGHLGRNPQTKTPNIDRLAKLGVTFTKAYCTAPSCNPSRASLMTGLRPSSTGCYNNNQDWRAGQTDDKTLNAHFARNGYRVSGAGKIYHSMMRKGEWTDYFAEKPVKAVMHPSAKDNGLPFLRFGPLANPDDEMPDYRVTSYCIEKMKEPGDKPWFIACGLIKPHLDWLVPKKWFDLFPLESIELPPHREDDLADIPPAGVQMALKAGDHAKVIESGRWKETVQAYLATIAFCDAQVGRLLDALEASPQRDNTLVCLWSDHGWSLGEKQHWRKFALWEEPTRTVFTWKVPGLTQPGGVCGRTVDFSSVFPTLCATTGLPLPAHLEGRDISPLLKNPQAAWAHPAITTWGWNNHAIRTEGWRYIRYAQGEEELYDETADPLEYTNLASNPEHAARKAELAKFLPTKNAKDLPVQKGGDGEDEGGNKKAKAKNAK